MLFSILAWLRIKENLSIRKQTNLNANFACMTTEKLTFIIQSFQIGVGFLLAWWGKIEQEGISVRFMGEMLCNIQLPVWLWKMWWRKSTTVSCCRLDAGGEDQANIVSLFLDYLIIFCQEKDRPCQIRAGQASGLDVHHSHHVEGWILQLYRTFH